MKKKAPAWLAFLVLMLVATLTSCEKFALEDLGDNSTHDANANVTIHVQKLQNTPIAYSTKAGDSKKLEDVCSRVSFVVFDGEEKLVAKNQTAEDSGFGTCHFSLDEGEYRLVVIAHNGAGNCSVSAPEKVKFYNNKMTDTFYYYGRLSVTEEGAKADINMQRAVAAFQLHITDKTLPKDVKSIKFYYTGGSSTLDATTGYGCVNSRQTETFNFTETGRDFIVYTFPHEEEKNINMTVSILDPDAKVTKTYQKTDLKMKCNSISKASISLEKDGFDGDEDDGDIGFTVDDEWGEDIIVYF